MTDLIQLDDAEIAAVAGGDQSNSTTQSNSATVTQNATATNSGNVTAVAASLIGGGNTAAAAGAEASNVSLISQRNRASSVNVFRVHIS